MTQKRSVSTQKNGVALCNSPWRLGRECVRAQRRGAPARIGGATLSPRVGKFGFSLHRTGCPPSCEFFSPRKNTGFIRQGRGPLPPKTLSVPELGDRGGGLTKPRPRAHEKILPHAVTYPRPPYRGQGNGVLTAGRGTSFTHGSEFFREKIHRAARIMRAPVRPGCGHISRTKCPLATRGCDPGSVHRFGCRTTGITRHGKAREGACMRVGI